MIKFWSYGSGAEAPDVSEWAGYIPDHADPKTCSRISPSPYWECTQIVGHPGPHIARTGLSSDPSTIAAVWSP